MSDLQPAEATAQRPPLRLVRGDATPEEIAAIIAVLAASGGGGAAEEEVRASRWADPHSRMRLPHSHGRGVWRGSALPR
ncbi:MAG: acyl-CoA carboxylase subunit epsilon [Intrasporangiaceae bacterium]|nr:acyl-CoA carboxylase subunit epsilon [Intrasporangiaceae bacterium]